MTNTTVDRFVLLEYNELTYPHRCATCGSFSGDNNKKFVDFGLFVEFYGNVYICTECFIGAVKSVNITDNTDKYDARINELVAINMTLMQENRTLRDVTDRLRNIDRPDTDTNNGNMDAGKISSGRSDISSPESEISNSNPARTNSVGEEREDRPSESINVQGSSDIRTDDDSLTSFGLGLAI